MYLIRGRVVAAHIRFGAFGILIYTGPSVLGNYSK